MKNVLIIIPTYNEALNIKGIIKEIYSHTEVRQEECISVLVVDDNSDDGTASIVKALRDDASESYHDCIHIIERSGKLGLGTAYIEGFKWAIKNQYDYVFEMDADFSHHPKYIVNFLDQIKEHDLVIGSRYVEGGGVMNWSFLRKLISRGGSFYARFFLGIPVKDVTGGFKCFKTDVLKSIDLDSIISNGYSFQIEVTYRVWLRGLTIKEIPIVFEDRMEGFSKMSGTIFREAIWKVLLFRMRKRKLMKRMRDAECGCYR